VKLELYPDAIKNFNEKAEKLLCEMSSIAEDRLPTYETSFRPDVYVSAIFSDNIIGPVKMGFTNLLGEQSARYFKQGDRYVGLFDEGHTNLVRLAEAMQKTKVFRETVSIGSIKDLLFEWIETKYKQATDLPMVEYVLDKVKKRIKELEIWIPVFMLHIQSDVRIGRILFKPITKEMIDNFQKRLNPSTPEQETVARQFVAKQRKELQGYAAATIKLVAEPERASEIAFEEAERSISLLRFFAPANLMPQIASHCVPWGKKHLESKRHLIIKDGEIMGSETGLADKYEPAWIVSDDYISAFKRIGLDTLSDLLNKDRRTEFEDALLNSLLLYSRSSLTKDISEKLVYILAALEPILLKDNTEPIQQNIGMRLAFLIGKTSEERISIKNNFTTTYGLRSQFVHHGNTIDDLRTLETFMRNVWLGFCSLIQFVSRFQSKQQLFKELEERIYS
jgi:hypothetical protein